jgi:hypothetical protein
MQLAVLLVVSAQSLERSVAHTRSLHRALIIGESIVIVFRKFKFLFSGMMVRAGDRECIGDFEPFVAYYYICVKLLVSSLRSLHCVGKRVL